MLKRRSNIPGFQEGGANIDPVSGNDVPIGSMPEEVRDDIDAKLSPGEFVLPADVVRFIGLERLMKMRDEAKKGLQRMSEIGQMGNADEVGEASNGTYEDEGFESEIDDILEEIEAEEQGRDVNEQTEVMMAEGGFMKSGTDLTKAPKNPVFDVRYYKNAEGSVMYITHINGKPMTPVPEGYKAVTQEEAQKVGQKADEAAKVEKKPEQESSYEFAPPDPGTFPEQSARNKKLDDFLTQTLPTAAKAALPFGMVPTLFQKAAGLFADQSNKQPGPIETRTPVSAEAIRAGADAEAAAKNAGLSDMFAGIASESAAAQVAQGVPLDQAVRNAVEAAAMDAYTIDTSRGTSTPSSRGSFAVSPASTAETSAVSSREGASRNLTTEERGDSSVGTPDTGRGEPESISTGDWGGLAKGGLVNKRQYPAKKKRGKGIASAKS